MYSQKFCGHLNVVEKDLENEAFKIVSNCKSTIYGLSPKTIPSIKKFK